ncbi:putative papain-like cysteine peptidase superfamily [Helianthus annuus]|nr:putative papain-like cysteine peptidase superfamily [Helianthus annuus]
MLEVFLNQFNECVKRINNTFTEGFQLYPESEKIKEIHTLWTEKLKKFGSTCTPTAQPQTPTDKTPEKEANKENVDMSQLSQWTPSLVKEICKTVDKTTTPMTQLTIVEQPAFVVTPISQRTQEEYEYSIRRGQLIHQLDLGKQKLRPQRQPELTDALRSPYVKRVVEIRAKLGNAEVSVSSYMFSAWGSMWDVVFRTKKGVPVMRSPLESLMQGMEVHILVISAWADLLNYEEKFKQKGSIARLFCSVNMLNEEDYIKNAKTRAKIFAENMEPVLISADVKKIPDRSLIFVPVLHNGHFYCICFNLRDMKVEVLDNNAKDISMQAKYKKRPEKLVRPSIYKLQTTFVIEMHAI